MFNFFSNNIDNFASTATESSDKFLKAHMKKVTKEKESAKTIWTIIGIVVGIVVGVILLIILIYKSKSDAQNISSKSSELTIEPVLAASVNTL